jgi:Co/Zn/Cd efflux system component
MKIMIKKVIGGIFVAVPLLLPFVVIFFESIPRYGLKEVATVFLCVIGSVGVLSVGLCLLVNTEE